MTGANEIVEGGDPVWNRTRYPRPGKPREIVYKAILANGRWTAVLDREMVMIVSCQRCEQFAAANHASILGCIAEGTSGTYAVYRYEPKKVRGLLVVDGTVHEDHGSPLPEEEGITKDSIFEDDIFKILERAGFPVDLFGDPSSKILVAELDGSAFAAPAKVPAPPMLPPPPPQTPARPWWKIG